MTRDPGRLATTEFDVLVVGAGIYGLIAAWDAALRGLSVALIDRGDFGAATSFNSLKTLHGGLRSLQRGSLAEVRQFIRERRALGRIAPHLVEPLAFIVPTSRHPLRSRLAMRVALTINDLIAHDRNDGIDPSRRLPASRTLSREACLAAYPGLDPRGVTGGAMWHDAQMYSADRLALSFVRSAAARGAVAANYIDATGFLQRGRRIVGVSAHDLIGGERFDIRARVTVNAAGPWARTLVDRIMPGRANPLVPRLSLAMNLVTARPAPPCALGGLVDGRFLFMVPWHGRAIFGTSHEPFDGGADDLRLTAAHVQPFLDEVNRAFPSARLSMDEVTLVHRGLLPTVDSRGRDVRLAKHSQVRDHRADGPDGPDGIEGIEGIEGLVSVVGVRYTTARHTAQQAVDLVFRLLGRQPPLCETAVTPIAGADMPDVAAFVDRGLASRPTYVSEKTMHGLLRRYGTAYQRVLSLMEEDPTLAELLAPETDVTKAEVVHAVHTEMAVKLADVVIRRTGAGAAGHPGHAAVAAAAALVGKIGAWDQATVDREISEVDAFYRLG